MAWEWLDNIEELTGEPMSSTGPHTNWNYCLANIAGTGNKTIGNDTGSEYIPTGGSGIYKCSGDAVTITTTYDLYISNDISSNTAHYRMGIASNTGRYVNASWRPASGSANYITFRFAVNHDSQEAVAIYVESSSSGIVGAYERVNQAWARQELYTKLMAHVVTGPKLKITYSIPQDTYSYCKLTYKKDQRPEDVTDGTSIDISPNSTTINVEGLDENQLYYFTIFTDKSESESVPFNVV